MYHNFYTPALRSTARAVTFTWPIGLKYANGINANDDKRYLETISATTAKVDDLKQIFKDHFLSSVFLKLYQTLEAIDDLSFTRSTF